MKWLAFLAILLSGALCVWLLYGDALREYIKKGDEHGANVTIVAMFGTFLPFFGFALMIPVIGP